MVQRLSFHHSRQEFVEDEYGDYAMYEDYQKLEAENARLRQRIEFIIPQISKANEIAAELLKQRDAANAQLDFILENKE